MATLTADTIIEVLKIVRLAHDGCDQKWCEDYYGTSDGQEVKKDVLRRLQDRFNCDDWRPVEGYMDEWFGTKEWEKDMNEFLQGREHFRRTGEMPDRNYDSDDADDDADNDA